MVKKQGRDPRARCLSNMAGCSLRIQTTQHSTWHSEGGLSRSEPDLPAKHIEENSRRPGEWTGYAGGGGANCAGLECQWSSLEYARQRKQTALTQGPKGKY